MAELNSRRNSKSFRPVILSYSRMFRLSSAIFVLKVRKKNVLVRHNTSNTFANVRGRAHEPCESGTMFRIGREHIKGSLVQHASLQLGLVLAVNGRPDVVGGQATVEQAFSCTQHSSDLHPSTESQNFLPVAFSPAGHEPQAFSPRSRWRGPCRGRTSGLRSASGRSSWQSLPGRQRLRTSRWAYSTPPRRPCRTWRHGTFCLVCSCFLSGRPWSRTLRWARSTRPPFSASFALNPWPFGQVTFASQWSGCRHTKSKNAHLDLQCRTGRSGRARYRRLCTRRSPCRPNMEWACGCCRRRRSAAGPPTCSLCLSGTPFGLSTGFRTGSTCGCS